jgi:hypothetical protein
VSDSKDGNLRNLSCRAKSLHLTAREWQETASGPIMRRFIVCTAHRILLERIINSKNLRVTGRETRETNIISVGRSPDCAHVSEILRYLSNYWHVEKHFAPRMLQVCVSSDEKWGANGRCLCQVTCLKGLKQNYNRHHSVVPVTRERLKWYTSRINVRRIH